MNSLHCRICGTLKMSCVYKVAVSLSHYKMCNINSFQSIAFIFIFLPSLSFVFEIACRPSGYCIRFYLLRNCKRHFLFFQQKAKIFIDFLMHYHCLQCILSCRGWFLLFFALIFLRDALPFTKKEYILETIFALNNKMFYIEFSANATKCRVGGHCSSSKYPARWQRTFHLIMLKF